MHLSLHIEQDVKDMFQLSAVHTSLPPQLAVPLCLHTEQDVKVMFQLSAVHTKLPLQLVTKIQERKLAALLIGRINAMYVNSVSPSLLTWRNTTWPPTAVSDRTAVSSVVSTSLAPPTSNVTCEHIPVRNRSAAVFVSGRSSNQGIYRSTWGYTPANDLSAAASARWRSHSPTTSSDIWQFTPEIDSIAAMCAKRSLCLRPICAFMRESTPANAPIRATFARTHSSSTVR